MFLASPVTALLLLPWAALWVLGGIALAQAAFRLRPNEVILVGLVTGWLVQNWLANLLAWVIPVPAAFWAASVLVGLAGLAAARRTGVWRLGALRSATPRSVIFPVLFQLLTLAALALIFFSISRGLAIFDDFAHLPTVSIMAAGDIPPHFSLDPRVVYGYHHFLLLFQAQLLRIGGLAPWTALDAGRALSFAAAVMLAALYTRRLTHSALAGFLAGLVMALGSGARWMLLLLPRALVLRLSESVTLIGSGAASGPDLASALLNPWVIEGDGPLAFPFAFANGIYPAGILAALGANGLVAFANILILLLTFNRWRSRIAAVLSVIFISIWGLVGEAELIAILAGWGIVTLAYLLARRPPQSHPAPQAAGIVRQSGRDVSRALPLPSTLLTWLVVVAAGCALGFLSGGAWTDLLVRSVQRLVTGSAPASYQTIGFTAALPAVVSSHLGPLSLLNPAQLLVALLELGPVLLVLPLLAAFGWKAYRLGRWYEAAAAASALFALLLVFVQFTGSTGVRNTPRLYFFMPLCAVFAVPLAWLWAARRSSTIKLLAAGLGLALVTGGAVLTGVALLAAQRPVFSSYLTGLDAQMASAYWNRLEPGALVFDRIPNRATALFGRPTDSHFTWYAARPEWEALAQSPAAEKVRQAGFAYAYFSEADWEQIDLAVQQSYTSGCPRLIDETADDTGAFRRLYDLSGCSP